MQICDIVILCRHIDTYVHMHMHGSVCTCIHIYIYIYTLTYIHTYVHTYIHTYIHTYVHTYTQTDSCHTARCSQARGSVRGRIGVRSRRPGWQENTQVTRLSWPESFCSCDNPLKAAEPAAFSACTHVRPHLTFCHTYIHTYVFGLPQQPETPHPWMQTLLKYVKLGSWIEAARTMH